MDDNNTVILGNTGFIGAAIERELRKALPGWTHTGVSRADCDLTAQEQAGRLVPLFTPTTVLIVCSGIKRQFGDTTEIFERNMQMVLNLSRVLERSPVRRIIYLSSAAVYGEERENTAIRESTPIDPGSLYGVAKFASERVLQRTASTIGSTLAVLRPPLVYGKGDSSKGYGPAGFEESILGSREISLWGDGSERREFLYLKDLARIVCALTPMRWSGVLNPVSGNSRTYRDCATIIRELLAGSGSIVERPRSKPKVDHVFDPSEIRSTLPEFHFTSLEDGLREMLSGPVGA